MATRIARIKTFGSNVKTKTKDYFSNVNTAYNVGYYSGVNDYKKIPKKSGARSSATYGYSKALKDSHRDYKFQKKLKKGGKFK
jgi:hypothetical protein